MGEGASQVRKGLVPRAMAVLRNVALGILRLMSVTDIAEMMRQVGETWGGFKNLGTITIMKPE